MPTPPGGTRDKDQHPPPPGHRPRRPPRKQRLLAHLLRAKMLLAYYVHATEPYSYPILAGYRGARKLIRFFAT